MKCPVSCQCVECTFETCPGTSNVDINVQEEFLRRVIPEPNTGCWLWLRGVTGGKYPSFKYQGFDCAGHRFSYKMHKGALSSDKSVCHTCDTPLCVNPDHLFQGTAQENFDDMVRKGRYRRGAPHHKGPRSDGARTTKLNWEQVRAIRASSASLDELASQYGVTNRNIWQIRKGITWKEKLSLVSEEQ